MGALVSRRYLESDGSPWSRAAGSGMSHNRETSLRRDLDSENGRIGRVIMAGRAFPVILAAVLGCAGEGGPADAGTSVSPAREACPAASRVPARVRFGLVGFWGTRTQEEAFEPVARFLSARIGVPVDLVAASRYDELADWISWGKVDVALVPPLAYVKARERIPCLRLLRTVVVGGAVHYSGYIVVRDGSPIHRVRDLAGRRIAFVEPSSASGFLFARYSLEQEGIDPDRNLAEAAFLGSHEAVIQAVLSGEADAGATFQGALERARQRGLDAASLRILAITGRIPLDALVATPDLDPRWVARLDEALDRLNRADPEGRAALSRLVDIVGWARSDDRLYDEVRDVVARSGGTGEEDGRGAGGGAGQEAP